MAKARAIATRCCCPPDKLIGYAAAFSLNPIQAKSSHALLGRSARNAFHATGCGCDVVQHGEMRKQVEVLEDEADFRTRPSALRLAARDAPPDCCHAVADGMAHDDDLARFIVLEHVDAPQQRRLAQSARTDENDRLLPRHCTPDGRA